METIIELTQLTDYPPTFDKSHIFDELLSLKLRYTYLSDKGIVLVKNVSKDQMEILAKVKGVESIKTI